MYVAYAIWRLSLPDCILDSTDVFAGCPVGLQLIGGPQEEEAVIAMTEIVDAALKAYDVKKYAAWNNENSSKEGISISKHANSSLLINYCFSSGIRI